MNVIMMKIALEFVKNVKMVCKDVSISYVKIVFFLLIVMKDILVKIGNVFLIAIFKFN